MSGAPDWVPEWLLLTPESAAEIAVIFLVLIIILDVYASGDEIPNNTPRELLLKLAKWKSPGAYAPMTGAFVPFTIGAVVGHLFHPWAEVGPLGADFPGLGAVVGIGVVLAIVTWIFDPQIDGKKWVVPLAVFGLVAGVVLWPVAA